MKSKTKLILNKLLSTYQLAHGIVEDKTILRFHVSKEYKDIKVKSFEGVEIVKETFDEKDKIMITNINQQYEK